MPDVHADSGASRPWRLPALVTGITLVGGSAVVRSTVERLHNQVCEVRPLRARLVGRRHEGQRLPARDAARATTSRAGVAS
jgi:hypothetical protein